MDPRETSIDPPSAVDSPSRRMLLGAGATGLALALLARSVSQATAQTATPAAEGGMPAGMAVLASSSVPVPAGDVPTGGMTLGITRLTLQPGAEAPPGALAHAAIDHCETGTLTCTGGAPRFVIAKDGSMREVGAEDAVVNLGESIYIPPNVADGARNDGSDLLTILRIELIPLAAGTATPSA